MSFINNKEKTCAICGHKYKYQSLGENNTFGMRDLDTRPPGMMRTLMHLMVEKCPKCHYASYDVAHNIHKVTVNDLKDKEYLQILEDNNLNFALKKFMLAGKLIEKHNNKLAGMTYLRAAWMADDSKNLAVARKMRSKAIKYLELSLKEEDNENIKLIVVDLYRRIDMFEEAFDYAKFLLNNVGMEKYKQNILLYQLRLCEDQDNLDHTIPGKYNFYNPSGEDDD